MIEKKTQLICTIKQITLDFIDYIEFSDKIMQFFFLISELSSTQYKK